MAVKSLNQVNGIGYLTPAFQPSGPIQAGAARETLFHFEDGNPMTMNMVEDWSIDPAGDLVRMTLKPGIPWYAPKVTPNLDLGTVSAQDVVEYLNRTNATLNPECVGGCSTFANVFGEAEVTGPLSLEVPLLDPIFFCLPLTEYGCLGGSGGLSRVMSVDEYGEDWAKSHEVNSGPFVQGRCVAEDRCTIHAVEDHWRKSPQVAEITAVHVPDVNSHIVGAINGTFDIVNVPFELVPDLVKTNPDRVQWIDVGSFIGQSLIFSGNLWEEFHAKTGEPLNPWDSKAYDQDFPWIGDPWQQSHPDEVRYADTDNPDGMTDMEQARLVRLALSYAIDRESINRNIMDDLGEVLYSEYMGPRYVGWDPTRRTGIWDSEGNRIEQHESGQDVPWRIEHDLDEAGRLLDLAGYPLDESGRRSGFGKLTFDGGPNSGELRANNLPVSDAIASDWAKLGIEVEYLSRIYPRDIQPQLRDRQQFYPVLKNGDVHSNILPLDFPLPIMDSSATRPGFGVGFESKPAARWFFEISAERNPSVREQMHLDWVDYSLFWVQYVGVYQAPKGTVASLKIADWPQDRVQFHNNWPTHYENIVLAN